MAMTAGYWKYKALRDAETAAKPKKPHIRLHCRLIGYREHPTVVWRAEIVGYPAWTMAFVMTPRLAIARAFSRGSYLSTFDVIR